eukprot:scaffold168_cov124-Cylindrotheca_fusiformis.AAC.23
MPSLEVVRIEDGVSDENDSDDETVDMEESLTAATATTPVKPGTLLPTQSSSARITTTTTTAVSNESPAAKQVTPADEPASANSTSSSKQRQQRKVNQMTLGNFFFATKTSSSSPTKSPAATNMTPMTTIRSLKKQPSLTKTSQTKSPVPVQSSEKEKPSAAPTLDCSSKELATTMATDENTVEKKKVELPANDETSKRAEQETTTVALPPRRKRRASVQTKTATASSPKAAVADPAKKDEDSKPLPRAEELSDERKALLKKHQSMKTRYTSRSQELVEEAKKGLPEEEYVMPEPRKEPVEGNDEFSDPVVANMVLLIEGSPLPLSKLAERVSQTLFDCHEKKWTTEAVSSKIKLLSQRKPCMEPSSSSTITATVDLFEDDTPDRMWRWEILTIDILPTSVLPLVRKARSARKKLSSHRSATTRLLQALEDAETAIANPCRPIEKPIAKVSLLEEKVLKYEREAEKKRMAEQAKKKKIEELESKKREKELEKERKRLEAEKRKQDLEAKKDEAQKAREEAKRKREMEKEEKAEQKKAEAEEQKKKLSMQKACLMSFFSGPPKKKARTPSTGSSEDVQSPHPRTAEGMATDSFDVDTFRKELNSGCISRTPLFPKLSSSAISSRKRRLRSVTLSVYVTVEPENAFDAQPFAEETTMEFPNKYRFLSFHEDCRPAYHGTWSKHSSIVTGKTPFAKDTLHLDYDYDSEAEWEEGDDEIGEDIEDEDKDEDDDEGDARIYDYEDGFCVADERYLDSEDDVDEETKALHQKKLQNGEGSLATRVCIVAPAAGGIPATTGDGNFLEGFDSKEGAEIMTSHQVLELCDLRMCLDAFPPPPPPLVDEVPVQVAASSAEVAGKDDYSVDEMKALARFAHHCELNSKEKLIEALRNAHPTEFTSRAKATRKLDTIATKKRFVNTTGVYWEVKKEVLEELELKDALAKEIVDESPQAVDAASSKVTPSKEKDTNAKSSAKKSTKKRKSPSQGGTAKKAQTEKPDTKDSPKKKTSPKKAAESPAMKASANLLAGFLVKKKPKKSTPEIKSPPISG